MQQRLREVGLRSIEQTISSDKTALLAWCAGRYPVVLKPAMSGGQDGVFFCHSDADVVEAYEANIDITNVNGEVNSELIAQELLQGTEYIVDCVSHEGRHIVSAIWKYWSVCLPESNVIFKRSTELLPAEGPVQRELTEYVLKCLDALGIRYGASHSEVFMTPDKGPCLVETGARMHGLQGPKMVEMATGLGTHELLADTLLGARLFNELYESNWRYILKKYAFETLLLNRDPGHLQLPIEAVLQKLDSCWKLCTSLQVGDYMELTRDLASAPAVICMLHADYTKCTDDIAEMDKIETSRILTRGEMSLMGA